MSAPLLSARGLVKSFGDVRVLRGIDLDVAAGSVTVLIGPSGSGKSSLVFGTIAAESQRMINETYSAFLQGFMPNLARPEVDVLEGLAPAGGVGEADVGEADV